VSVATLHLLTTRRAELQADLALVEKRLAECRSELQANLPQFAKGCLGPSVFDWYVQCQHHGISQFGKDRRIWCGSCDMAEDHNYEIQQRLEALKAEIAGSL